ncbi:efflux transporter outer membrane subunit [uncultured Methylibium sp.]|uniref:efflux transporter outer membrane subunit n=1 Tax=uncultured Methylibium sp. TaxID=381093 RepID=UPI0025ED88F9|nr:efflux transporter outer membrane subunit [uncultured Methylibium sp.]
MTKTTPLLAALLLAGCAVGPDYQRPASTLDAGFIAAGAASANAQPTAADIASFWRGFNDATLSALVDRALAANGDVRIAQARLQEARANQGEADALSRPGLGLSSDVTRSVRPITQQPGASRSERTGTVYDASFIANWELDFFGRYRRGSEAAAALVAAGEAGIGAAHTAVAAEVARNYLELRGLQQRLQVTEASLVNQREALKITQARLDAGRGTQLDLARATSLVAGTEAALPALQAAIERTVFRLATLTARPPRALLAELQAPAPLPGLPVTDLSTLPLGTPEQWLQRRPDLIAAERQLAAATANIGVARSELFPRVSLSGLLGLNAATLSNLGKSESGVYSLGVGLTWTPFDLGQIRSRIAATEARAQASLASYEQTVATALEETEGAFSSYTRNAQRAERLDVAARSAEEAAQLARQRYDAGVTDFLAVLDAEREVLSNRDQWVQAQVGTATALVSVYRALGGGWAAPATAVSSSR